jgi:hypothetical protein
VLVWDLNRAVNPNLNKMRAEGDRGHWAEQTVAIVEQKSKPDILFEPKYHFSNITDDVQTLAWFLDSKTELLYGQDKYIRICDTRDHLNYKS